MKILMMTVLISMEGLRACGQLIGGINDLALAVNAVEERERRHELESRVAILEEEQAVAAERARIREAMARLESPAVAVLGVAATESFGPGSAEALTRLVYLELAAAGRHPLELGSGVAADKVVRPVVLPDGFGCIVGLELRDRASDTRDWAITARTACDGAALAEAAHEMARAMPSL